MKECTYGCRLWIDTGDEHPEVITKGIGIQPTTVSIKGSETVNDKGRKVISKQNLWELHGPKRYSDDEWNLCNCIEDITDILDVNEVKVREVFHQYENKGFLIYCDVYSTWIQFRVQPEILHKMRKYNMLIDFSILAFDEDK